MPLAVVAVIIVVIAIDAVAATAAATIVFPKLQDCGVEALGAPP